jgi:hypothetical protein
MWLRNCARQLYCINDRCFESASAAGRYLMELSSRGEVVTITHRLDMEACFTSGTKKA